MASTFPSPLVSYAARLAGVAGRVVGRRGEAEAVRGALHADHLERACRRRRRMPARRRQAAPDEQPRNAIGDAHDGMSQEERRSAPRHGQVSLSCHGTARVRRATELERPTRHGAHVRAGQRGAPRRAAGDGRGRGAARRRPRAQGAGGVGGAARRGAGVSACCGCATPSPSAPRIWSRSSRASAASRATRRWCTRSSTLLDLARPGSASTRRPRSPPRRVPLHLMKHRSSEVELRAARRRGRRVAVELPAGHPDGRASSRRSSRATPAWSSRARSRRSCCSRPRRSTTRPGCPRTSSPSSSATGRPGQALIDAGIDFCVFTGAVETGRKVAAACGQRLIPCTMELGRQGAAHRLRRLRRRADGAAPSSAAGSPTAGRCASRSSGSTRTRGCTSRCSSGCARWSAGLRQGDPARDFVDVGAIIFPKQIDVARKHVEDAAAEGRARSCAAARRCRGRGSSSSRRCSPSATTR